MIIYPEKPVVLTYESTKTLSLYGVQSISVDRSCNLDTSNSTITAGTYSHKIVTISLVLLDVVTSPLNLGIAATSFVSKEQQLKNLENAFYGTYDGHDTYSRKDRSFMVSCEPFTSMGIHNLIFQNMSTSTSSGSNKISINLTFLCKFINEHQNTVEHNY